MSFISELRKSGPEGFVSCFKKTNHSNTPMENFKFIALGIIQILNPFTIIIVFFIFLILVPVFILIIAFFSGSVRIVTNPKYDDVSSLFALINYCNFNNFRKSIKLVKRTGIPEFSDDIGAEEEIEKKINKVKEIYFFHLYLAITALYILNSAFAGFFIVIFSFKAINKINVAFLINYFSNDIFNYKTTFIKDIRKNIIGAYLLIIKLIFDFMLYIASFILFIEFCFIIRFVPNKFKHWIYFIFSMILVQYNDLTQLIFTFVSVNHIMEKQKNGSYDYDFKEGNAVIDDVRNENLPFYLTYIDNNSTSKRYDEMNIKEKKIDNFSLSFLFKFFILIVIHSGLFISVEIIESSIKITFRNDTYNMNKDVFFVHVVNFLSHKLPISFILMFTNFVNLSPLLFFVHYSNIFKSIFFDPNIKRYDINNLNKISIKLDKYYIIDVPKSIIHSVQDESFVNEFTGLINNDFDAAMKLLNEYESNTYIKDFVNDLLQDPQRLLLKDIDVEFTANYISFVKDGYKYTITGDVSMFFMNLEAESGGGKTTMARLITGYIDSEHVFLEGMNNGEVVSFPSYRISRKSKSLIPFFSNFYDDLVPDYTLDKILGLFKYDYWDTWKILISGFGIGRYIYDVDTKLKYIPMSSGQNARLSGSNLMIKIISLMEDQSSFFAFFDELLGNVDNKNRIKILNVIKNLDSHVKTSKRKSGWFIISMIDHSPIAKEMLIYDLIISIEDKVLNFSIKSNGFYVGIPSLFGKWDNEVTVGNFKISRVEAK